ncbi:MAG TPA: hypothetical protein VFW53_05780 [Gallionella sp.]|nr:hypothetical protein [Gallionella sp.]
MLASTRLCQFALLTSLFASQFLAGCSLLGGKPEAVTVANKTQSYFEVQRAYASALEQVVGSEDKSFRIVPVLFAAYARGSILKMDSVDPVTSECRAGAAKLTAQEDQLINFPTINTNRSFSLSGGISKDVASLINEAVNFGANVTSSTTLTLGYEGGKQEVIPANDVLRFIREDRNCARAIVGQRVMFVRGQIFARMEVTSESKLGLGANAKAKTIANFEIKWDDKGGFELKDTKAVPRFLIVSELLVNETAKSGDDAEILSLPGDMEKGAGGKGPVGEAADWSRFPAGRSQYSAVILRPSDQALERLR